MARYGKFVDLEPSVVLARAARYFGEEGVGLTLRERDDRHVILEGAGGFVAVSATPTEDDRTNVDLMTREWDIAVRDFMGKL